MVYCSSPPSQTASMHRGQRLVLPPAALAVTDCATARALERPRFQAHMHPLHCTAQRLRHKMSRSRRRYLQVQAGLGTVTLPRLLPATTPWGIWAVLVFAAAAGFWSENTSVGKQLSGALVATLLGMAFSNLGVIPSDAPYVYDVVYKYLLPLAIPLLLFSADLRRVVRDTGRLLLAFVVGSLGTIAGTLVAMQLLPLRSLGTDGWKVAAALAARHIGGAVNYVAVAETTAMSPSAMAAGLAADNLLCALYFTTVYALARNIGPDPKPAAAAGAAADLPSAATDEITRGIKVVEGTAALAVGVATCYIGTAWAGALGQPGISIPIITAIAVAMATVVPRLLAPLVESAEGLAAILIQIFFVTVGANGSIATVLSTAPSLFLFSLIQIAVHLGLMLGVGRLLGFERRDLLLASNANVGGPTTAAGMAAAKGWRLSLVPALLVGIFGYAVATFLCVALGLGVLRHM